MVSLIRRYSLAASLLGVGLLSAILYWPSLTLPVLYDDLLHIRIVKGLNLWTVWLPTEKFGFYRPLTFLPLLLIERIFGFYPQWLLHGLNVLQHSLNAMLLVALGRRLGQPPFRAFAAGLLFAFFPFSYQAVAVYGHNVHPAVTGLFLLGLHTYLTAIRLPDDPPQEHHRQRRFWWGITGFLFLLSLLSHESAILFGAFAALLHWNEQGALPGIRLARSWFQRRRLPPWFIFLLLGGAYFVGYQFLPISRAPQAAGDSGGWWLRLLYLLQAAGYPLTWFAHRLSQVDAISLILGGLAVTLGLTIWMTRQRQARLPLLLAWGWWALASLLIAIPLPTEYLLHGPRLLYLSSVGLALLWAQLLVGRPAVTWRNGISLMILAFVLLTNWQFVRDRLAQYSQLTQPVEIIASTMESRPAHEGIVIVNLPQWLAPARNRFALGAELVAMLGSYLFADELVAENLAGEHAVYAVVVPDLLTTTAYPYGTQDESDLGVAGWPIRTDWLAEGSQFFIIRYAEDGPQTRHVGSFRPLEDSVLPIAAFASYDLIAAKGSFCESTAQVDLVWKQPPGNSVPPTISIFVQLLAGDGRLVAQSDGPPLGLRSDLIQWQPGWAIQELRTLNLDPSSQPTELLIGVYDFVSGDRLPATDSQDRSLPDNAFRLPVTADCP